MDIINLLIEKSQPPPPPPEKKVIVNRPILRQVTPTPTLTKPYKLGQSLKKKEPEPPKPVLKVPEPLPIPDIPVIPEPVKSYKLTFNPKVPREEEPPITIFIDKPVRKQELECIGLLTTSFELESGRLKTFLERTLPTLAKQNMDFVIFLNKKVDITELIAPYNEFFTVVVVSHDIAERDDVRIQGPNTLEYGGCSGPNIHFLKSARYCKKYNTTLFLETDCIVQEGWLNACINYVKYSGTFLVSGATYDGLTKFDFNDYSLYHHINGVAFYNTGSPYFEYLLEETDSFIRNKAKLGEMHAYDVAMALVCEKNIKQNYVYWRFIFRQITKNTLIVNYSLPTDKDCKIDDILFRFPEAVIIHKKN